MAPVMTPLDLLINPGIMLPALIIAGTVIGVMHAFASMLRNETYLHDVRVATAELKARYVRELRRLHGLDDPDEGEIIDADEAPPMMMSTKPDARDDAADRPARRAA